MSEMTPRERFLATMRFKKSDHLPLCEWLPIPDDTIICWLKEGLPLTEIIGQQEIFYSCVMLSKSSNYWDSTKYFGFDKVEWLSIDFGPIPRFVTRTLEETDRYRILIDAGGIKKKLIKGRSFGMPQFLDWQVKDRKDWEKIKMRFNPADPRRYPLDWSDEFVKYYETLDHVIHLLMPGFFATGRQLMGTVPFVSTFYKDPELTDDIMNFWAEFLIETMREFVETLKSRIDCVTIHEDMSYKHGPHISPRVFREFMLPRYKRVTGFLRHNGIDIIFVDSDGDIRPLIPLLLEGGVNGLWPLEVAAGMDAVTLRKEYGKRLLLIGNIDKRAIAEGKTAIEKEIGSKLPYLRKEGGYIPSIDHEVPPDIPYQNYVYYLNFLKKFL